MQEFCTPTENAQQAQTNLSATKTRADYNGHDHAGTVTNTLHTVEELASANNFTRLHANGKTEYHGPNPSGNGATDDGFILNDDGTAFDRKLNRRFTSPEVAELFGVAPDAYAPCAEYRQRNGHHAPAVQPTKPKVKREVAHDYHDANGTTIFQALRREYDNGSKDFLQRRPDGRGGWIYNLQGITPILYRLPEVIAAEMLIICEGEKAADRLNDALERAGKLGPIVATTNAGGAGKWKETHSANLTGKRVIFLPDNDEPGEKHAAKALPSIATRAASVQLLRLPNLPHKGDVCDFLDKGGTLDQLLRLAYQAHEQTPELEKASRFTLLSLSQILARPRLNYLVQDVLLERGTSVITADYGSFKSFNALDMALCVATGKDWHGRKVKRGPVVFIMPEGAYTTADRLKAWLIRYGYETPPENFFVIESSAQIAEPSECLALINELREVGPAFVILDTLAKCNVGRDENSAQDMGLFTHGMEKISQELNAQVTAIHHNNKNGTARGSVSLPSNVDTSIALKATAGRVVTFECDKQKGAPFEPFTLIGRIVELCEFDEYGRAVTSLIFEPTDAPAAEIPKADQTREQVFDVLRNAPEGLSASGWQRRCETELGIKESRFYDHRDALKKAERIAKDGRIYQVTPITPITPIRSKSEDKSYSDYSDDALASEQSEQVGENEQSKPNRSNQSSMLNDSIFDDDD
jgi:hypothetical protein